MRHIGTVVVGRRVSCTIDFANALVAVVVIDIVAVFVESDGAVVALLVGVIIVFVANSLSVLQL